MGQLKISWRPEATHYTLADPLVQLKLFSDHTIWLFSSNQGSPPVGRQVRLVKMRGAASGVTTAICKQHYNSYLSPGQRRGADRPVKGTTTRPGRRLITYSKNPSPPPTFTGINIGSSPMPPPILQWPLYSKPPASTTYTSNMTTAKTMTQLPPSPRSTLQPPLNSILFLMNEENKDTLEYWAEERTKKATRGNGTSGPKEAPAVISSAKASSGQSDSSDGGSGSKDAAGLQPERRPRSGTWSVANSRRVKIKAEKEEDASLRVRRKSGDDILAVSSNTGNGSNVSSNRRKEGGPQGFFDSFRPRSKSDARAIMASRQRRKSGDDILNTSTKEKEKEKKKDDSPGFFQSFRPRSKSDASRMAKKPNIMTTMKHAVQNWSDEKERKRREREKQRQDRQLALGRFSKSCQQSLVSPGQSGRSSGGRRSGEATPVDQGTPSNDVYHTWHAGAGSSNLHKNRQQEQRGGLYQLMDLFKIGKHRGETTEDRLRRKSGGSSLSRRQLLRRHSVEPDKRRAHGSGGSMVYLRGEMDPCTAAMLFRDSRGLPAADPFLENIKRSDLEEDETQIFVKFFKYHHCYDLIPISAKLVVFDTRLQVKKAFYALVYNGVRAAPLWDSVRQCFVGMLTITDFIRILQNFYAEPNRKMEELEDHRLETWRTVLKDEDRPLISIKPDESLYEAIRRLIHHKIHRLPVIDHITGNVLYIITHKRILKFLYLYINELPKPFRLQQTLREVQIGTYDGIETAKEETTIIEALNKFVKHRVSALPIVDEEGKLIDIYAKFDVINLAAEGTYNNLDVTLKKANEYRNEWFEQVHRCTQEETLGTILERIVRAEVHRLVVVDQQDKVIGVISLSDILKELVLRPCDDQDPFSLKAATIARMEAALSAEKDSKSPTSPVMNPPSSQDIIDDTQEPQSITTQVNINGLHKTVSDDSVGDKWSSDEKLQRCGSSSSGVGQREDGTDSSQAINKAAVAGAGDSEEDEGRYSMGDMDDSHSSSVVQPEVIPITGR
ncbi:unnamed protein product, partial [Meganyctiphanes norvegica]